jgi:hypothetical protein
MSKKKPPVRQLPSMDRAALRMVCSPQFWRMAVLWAISLLYSYLLLFLGGQAAAPPRRRQMPGAGRRPICVVTGVRSHEHPRPCLLSGLRNVSRCGDFRRRRGWARRRWRRWLGRTTTSYLVSLLPAFLLTWTFRRTGVLLSLVLFCDSVSEMCVAKVIEWDYRQLLCRITWYRCTKSGVQFCFVSAGRSTQLLSEVLLCMYY